MAKYEPIKMQLAKTIENQSRLNNIKYVQLLNQLGYSRTLIFCWVKIAKEQDKVEFKIASGPPAIIESKYNIENIKKSFNNE